MANVSGIAAGGSKKNVLVDHNAVVKEGMQVVGSFAEKSERAIVVHFKVGEHLCSGVLHVSQFPSRDRAERDRMFEVASVGISGVQLLVAEVVPPQDGFKLTVVRLTARPDFDRSKFARSRVAGTYRTKKKA